MLYNADKNTVMGDRIIFPHHPETGEPWTADSAQAYIEAIQEQAKQAQQATVEEEVEITEIPLTVTIEGGQSLDGKRFNVQTDEIIQATVKAQMPDNVFAMPIVKTDITGKVIDTIYTRVAFVNGSANISFKFSTSGRWVIDQAFINQEMPENTHMKVDTLTFICME